MMLDGSRTQFTDMGHVLQCFFYEKLRLDRTGMT